ncbi:isoprenoid synthase domain-containing protein [Lentinula lateritia]|uniref:Isoprenoid synthase domain-containing protein n=1 Tax=Lentinula aff. lateritia TaxID=2804960 RepID=A0ACC1TTA8_9AGAR|nr:isoprenoid synthase domain-containing protein [Lentinula aff. lateritia]KAJ3851988.1 isoprenoid synthase domain-containing protein [Lentinula lateritia]
MSIYDNILDRLSAEYHWTQQNEAAVLEPFTFVTSNPGKDMRGRLIEAFNLWLNVPLDKIATIAKIVNMLHAASLMVDDIEDDSQLRRGRPVAHKVYGIPQTINTANYVYFLAFQELFTLNNSLIRSEEHDLHAIVNAELLSLHRGQGLEILWRDSLSCPSEEEYIDMVNNKTGGLLRIGIKLMMACSTTTSHVDYVPLVNLIGVYFQIRDDLMNLQSPEYATNKGFAEDLTEGKFSFPVVHSIHADTSNRQILNVLQKRPTTPTLKTYAISYLKYKTKSFNYTLGVLEKLHKQALAEISRLGGNKALVTLMESFVVDRARVLGVED